LAGHPNGPKAPRPTTLSAEQEAIIVAFRRHAPLPLDDCLHALQATIPRLTRSSLHRRLQRHGVSRLPEVEGDKATRRAFKAEPIGFLHIDIAEVQTAEGKPYPFVAINHTSEFGSAQVVESAARVIASAVPYRIRTVPTDGGILLRLPPRCSNGPTARYPTQMFDLRCAEHGIAHRFTRINHPRTNGHVERMNRAIEDATVKCGDPTPGSRGSRATSRPPRPSGR